MARASRPVPGHPAGGAHLLRADGHRRARRVAARRRGGHRRPRTEFGRIARGLGEPARDRVPGRAAPVLDAARAGRRRPHRRHLRDQRRCCTVRSSTRSCSRWPSPSGSPRSCCPPCVDQPRRRVPRGCAAAVLVKRLVCIEDLGNVDVLFTDKTGTLTDGRISFMRALGADGAAGRRAAACSGCSAPRPTDGDTVAGGNPLDVALWQAPPPRRADRRSRRTGGSRVLPFDHERRWCRCSSTTPTADALVTKGAPRPSSTAASTSRPRAGRAGARVRRRQPGRRRRQPPCRRRGSAGPRTSSDLHLRGLLVFLDPPKADARRGAAPAGRARASR